MSNTERRKAIRSLQSKRHIDLVPNMDCVERMYEIWASDVFDLPKMQGYLPAEVYNSLKETIETGKALNIDVADQVAEAMMEWAISKNARYYSHVFYPLTGNSAEKHDSFINISSQGGVIEHFSGKLLVRGEPDASSFPSGGIRSTFEARGYTAWDVTSPAYIMHTPNGATLCIPTAFVSWTGEALDKKTPLLRSDVALNKAAQRVLKILGHDNVDKVNSFCGPEQEYFLIDEALAALRPDILLTGRTLVGKSSAKGQEFGDHYFGVIPQRVQVFMQEVEDTLYRLGIPAKTRHNETAPAQYEIAPLFEVANVATDHQQLTVTVLRTVAKKHGFMCILHEKPFAGVNGSGKHINWSIGNKNQGNLFEPGETPQDNAQFLLFCAGVIRSVHKYGHLLRAVVASVSNDHRLGGHEAPPAIISMFLGEELTRVFGQIKDGALAPAQTKTTLHVGVDTLPKLPLDSADRNRTSPFAFTGNRFEFRSAGSSQSIAGPLVALNSAMAESLHYIADRLEQLLKELDLNAAIELVLKEIMVEHGKVVFNGNGYDPQWQIQAVQERSLANLPTAVEALPMLKSPEVVEMLSSLGVLSATELSSRFEIYAEHYIKSIEVEAKVLIEIVRTQVLPAAFKHLQQCALWLNEQPEMPSMESPLAKKIGAEAWLKYADIVNENQDYLQVHWLEMQNLTLLLQKSLRKLVDISEQNKDESLEKQMHYMVTKILPLQNEIRMVCDAIESEIPDDLWPLPTYSEMLWML
ncbi:MAG: glutamine synthetase type III [Fibrobacter sp.]|nr:glutamine synthetase type III [Fibrobacter sp.]